MNQDTKKVIDICIQAPAVTKEVLQAALRDFLHNKTEKKGNIKFGELYQRSGGKLESIEVTENNIRDFLGTAAKFDIDFSLKRDKSTQPPTYHVFFATRNTDNFKRAFTEYAVGVQQKINQPKEATITMQQVHDNQKVVDEINQSLKKDKVLEKQKNKQESL